MGLAVHWPGTTAARFGVETADEVASRIRAWRDYHVDGRGWSDIGYNMAVDPAGRIWELRGIDRVGAHAASDANPDANEEYVGVLLILGANERPTTAMVQAFRHFRQHTFLDRWPGRTEIRGHQQVPGASTSCPGPYALKLVADGTLSGDPRPEEDDMTPEQMLDALDSKRGREILRRAVLDHSDIRDAAEGSTTAGRWLRDNVRDMLLAGGLDEATADAVIDEQLPKSMIEDETLGVAVARMRRQLDQVHGVVVEKGAR